MGVGISKHSKEVPFRNGSEFPSGYLEYDYAVVAGRRSPLIPVLRKNCSILILSAQYDWYKTDHLSCFASLPYRIDEPGTGNFSVFRDHRHRLGQNVPVDKSRCHNNRVVNVELGGDQHGYLLIKRVKHTI